MIGHQRQINAWRKEGHFSSGLVSFHGHLLRIRENEIWDLGDKLRDAEDDKTNNKVKGNENSDRFVEAKFLEEAVRPNSRDGIVEDTNDAVGLMGGFETYLNLNKGCLRTESLSLRPWRYFESLGNKNKKASFMDRLILIWWRPIMSSVTIAGKMPVWRRKSRRSGMYWKFY